jgi:hypothetical protein
MYISLGSPSSHAKSMAIVTTCDMYNECAEGKLDPSLKVQIEDFHTFRERLLEQMLQYNPRHRLYPGDDNLRDCTQQNKKQRQKSVNTGTGLTTAPAEKRDRGRPKKNTPTIPARASVQLDAITQDHLKESSEGRYARFCGNITTLTHTSIVSNTTSTIENVHFVASIQTPSVWCAMSGCIFFRQQGKQMGMIDFSSGTVKHTLDSEE